MKKKPTSHTTQPAPETATPEPERPNGKPSRRRFLGELTAATVAVSSLEVATRGAVSTPVEAQELGPLTGQARADRAQALRNQTALFQRILPLPEHPNNGDEDRYPNRIASFHKGLPHNQLGEVELSAYEGLLRALNTGNPDEFARLTMGGSATLKSPQSGLAYEMVGPDSHHLFLPPPPAFSSAEEAAEMAELYWQALTRDVNFLDYETNALTNAAAVDLSRLSDFRGPRPARSMPTRSPAAFTGSASAESTATGENDAAEAEAITAQTPLQSFTAPRRRAHSGAVTTATLFRGTTPGDLTGPYLSQFLWKDIPYGAQTISQRIRTTLAGDDYLTAYDAWLEAQRTRGDVNLPNRYDTNLRYIRNSRDLSEWVHLDLPFQAYYNTVFVLAGMGAPVDAGNPYATSKTEYGFVTFGPPHLAALIGGVAAAALKAVWFQKWYVHRRLRPEAFGGRLHNHLTRAASYPLHADILNSAALPEIFRRHNSYLLPQAFPEGAPTHPAYGAGHATVAGACVTVLKAWFKEDWVIPNPVVPSADGLTLTNFRGGDLTVGGELNKLASNIALGRNAGGVHWRSDATESLKLGEAVAIGYLTDLRATYNERFNGFSLTKFDGVRVIV